MLSDSEARRLAQLEALLWDDDPEFVQRFDASWDEKQRRPLPPWLLWVCVPVVVLALLVVNALLLVAALFLTCAAVYLWGLKPLSLRARSPRSGPGRRQPRP
jgi:nicotinamide riboside transporter PnuC